MNMSAFMSPSVASLTPLCPPSICSDSFGAFNSHHRYMSHEISA